MTETVTYDIALLNTSGAQRNPLEFLSTASEGFKDSIKAVKNKFGLVENYNKVREILGADTVANLNPNENSKPNENSNPNESLKLGNVLNVYIKDKTGKLNTYKLSILNDISTVSIERSTKINTSLLYYFVEDLNKEIGGESRIFSGIDNEKTVNYKPVLTEYKEFINQYEIHTNNASEILKSLGANNEEYIAILNNLKILKDWNKIGKYNILASDEEPFENGIKRHIIFYFVYQLFLIEVFINYLKKKTNTEDFKKLFAANFVKNEKKDEVLSLLFNDLGDNGVLMLNEVDKELKSIKSLEKRQSTNETGKSDEDEGKHEEYEITDETDRLSVITKCYTGSGDKINKGDRSVIISKRKLVELNLNIESQEESSPLNKLGNSLHGFLVNKPLENSLISPFVKETFTAGKNPIKEACFALDTETNTVFICIHNNSNTPKDLVIYQIKYIDSIFNESGIKYKYVLGIDTNSKELQKTDLEKIKEKTTHLYHYPQVINPLYTQPPQNNPNLQRAEVTSNNITANNDFSTTTNKHRTILQSQWSKAETDRSTKDLIITNIIEIDNPRIQRKTEKDGFLPESVNDEMYGNLNSTTNSNITEGLIPDEHHLFDHFIVRGSIITKIHKIIDEQSQSTPLQNLNDVNLDTGISAGGARKRKRKLKHNKRSLKLRGGYKKTRKRRRKNNKKRSRKRIVRKLTRKRN